MSVRNNRLGDIAMKSFTKYVSFLVCNLLISMLVLSPVTARAGWSSAPSPVVPDTTYGLANLQGQKQLVRPYHSRAHGISGTFFADVAFDGTLFEIVMVDHANQGDPCEIHVFGDEMYYEQWNTETCDPNRIFVILAIVFPEGIDDSIIGDWWESNGQAFGPGGSGDPTNGIPRDYGREDNDDDDDAAECLGSVAMNCALAFVGAAAAVLTISATMTPAGGAAVAVVAGLAVGINCGAAVYQDCIDNFLQMLLELIDVESTVDLVPDGVIDIEQLIDYAETLAGNEVIVQSLDPQSLLGDGSGFVVTFMQPHRFGGALSLGGVPVSVLQ